MHVCSGREQYMNYIELREKVESTTEITQNKYVKVLHYFVIDGMGHGHCFAQGPIMLLRRQHTMYMFLVDSSCLCLVGPPIPTQPVTGI
jgi:hypothetical protein